MMKKGMATKAIEAEAPIIENRAMVPGIFLLRIRSQGIAGTAQPGQFLHMRIENSFDPFLRRPFSVHRVFPEADEVQVLYQVTGRGTEVLSRKHPGEIVNCIGPLGKGFDPLEEERRPLIVSGGMGIAPLIFLVERFFRDQADVPFLMGGASRSHILYEKELKEWGVRVEIATNDGSLGHRGLVTDLVARHLGYASDVQMYACGPIPMCARISEMAIQYHVPCQLSLENWMGCGMGACLGCAVPVRSEGAPRYKRVCADGPVFDAREMVFG